MSLRDELHSADQQALRALEECRQHDRQNAERAEVIRKSNVQKDLGGFGLHYGVHENPPLRQRPIQPQSEPEPDLIVMSTAAQSSWNSWCQAHISRALDDINDAVAEFTVEFVAEKLQPLRDRIAELEKQIAALRSARDPISREYVGDIPIIRKRRENGLVDG